MRPETLRPELAHADEFDLCGRRVHEAEGRGRRTFALFQAVRHPGPLVWILPAHVPELPMLRGLPKGVGERLHLFRAEGETGLMLIREGAGSNATETRWACAPVASPAADSTLHCWTLNKNKKGTCGSWIVNWNGATAAVHLVSEAGQRHQPAEPPG